MQGKLGFLVAALALTSGSSAVAVQLDSAAFSHQYNGDAYPVPDYTELDLGGWATAPSTDGDILSFAGVIPGGNTFVSDLWNAAVSDAVGWTAEFRLKIEDDAEEGPSGAFQTFLGDDGPGKTSMGFEVGKSDVKMAGDIVIDTNVNTDGFHTFRIAQTGGNNDFLVWRDTVLLGTFSEGTHELEGLDWSDGSGAIGGPTVRLDYFRFDNTGGYEPVMDTMLTGDLNDDGFVGQDDLNIILGNWGQNVTMGDWMQGDPSNDGFVGQDDLNDVLGGWGQGTPPLAALSAVPEPQSLFRAVDIGSLLGIAHRILEFGLPIANNG